jgi:hypothetical protein
MQDSSTARIRNLVRDQHFSQAVIEINNRYRELGSTVLEVLSQMLTILVTPTFPGDVAVLGSMFRLCPPPPRSRLQAFVTDQRSQNCLTAVLRSLEKEVPSSVRAGFRSAADCFRESEFHSTYRADIVQYEPELRRLTDLRLARLISPSPDSLDWSLFDDPPLKKKQEVLAAYDKESLRPIAEAFGETLDRVDNFFDVLSGHADRFKAFFALFDKERFEINDDIVAEWSLLGDEYFHIELSKSSLMLPISPKALYWGMHDEYPETLALLKELKALVTPEFRFAGPVRNGGGWAIDVSCENPGPLKGNSFDIEPALHLKTDTLPAEFPAAMKFTTVEPGRSYRMTISLPPGDSSPASLSLRIACKGRYYTRPFRVEKRFDFPAD